ncbi:MAG: metallophosphoesterase [Leptolyngbyaceae cyanobacterium SM2_5_2]|nr:metallophosphoesterase [Leptolyngbyaceae cyanobacterium SM2_5_2]
MRPLLIGPLTLETVTIPIRNLPPRLEGCRIVQLSDFHYDGQRLPTPLLEAVIAQVSALAPDLVALTGDYVTSDPSPIFRLSAYLSQLNSRYGTVAVLGNHDNLRLGGRRTILRELQRAGVQALWNQIIYPLSEDLPVVGLAEFWSKEFNPKPLLDSLPTTTPRLVLSHNPDSAAELAPYRVDLQLSGHTHGGQIVLPGLGRVPALVQRLQTSQLGKLPLPYLNRKCGKILHHWEWAAGLHQIGNNWLYVNRGLGTYAPGRFRCPPEVTLITLVSA